MPQAAIEKLVEMLRSGPVLLEANLFQIPAAVESMTSDPLGKLGSPAAA